MGGWKRLGLVFLTAGLPACGGGGSVTQPCPGGTTGTPPNCVATPPPCTQTTVDQDSGALGPRTIVYNDFSVPDSGRLDITLDWTFATSRFGFYLVPANTCTLQEFNARSCNFVVRSEASTVKPRKISQENFTAGNYRWMVANFAEVDESVFPAHQAVQGFVPGPRFDLGRCVGPRRERSSPDSERAKAVDRPPEPDRGRGRTTRPWSAPTARAWPRPSGSRTPRRPWGPPRRSRARPSS